MATLKNSIARTSPLSILSPARNVTPLKPSFIAMQPILPEIASRTPSPKHRPKKRVRFALALDSIEESPSFFKNTNSAALKTEPGKQTLDPWRENGPLYGAYIEYLEKHDALTPDIMEINREVRPSSPVPDADPSTYTHTFVIQSKSPELIIDSITVSTPPLPPPSSSSTQLPQLVRRTSFSKIHSDKKQPLPIIHSYSKQRSPPASPHNVQLRRMPTTMNNGNHLIPMYPPIRRAKIPLRATRDVINPNEHHHRTDLSLTTRYVNDYFRGKKLTEIVTNPLPGINNQINHVVERPAIPHHSRSPQISGDIHINNETYFFQNHSSDHLQPVIHFNQ